MNALLYAVLPLAGAILGWAIRLLYARFQLSSAEQKAERVQQEAVKEAEAKKKELILDTKDKLLRERNQQEKEFRDQRVEVQQLDRRLVRKEENLARKSSELEQQLQSVTNREGELRKRVELVSKQEKKWDLELERISALTADEAKSLIMQSMENEARHDGQVIVSKIEQEALASADKKARDIIVSTIQRLATEVSSEATVTSVSLPNDEMKGRIIGREGRNIRTLETLTGVDIIIDDTPGAVVISCFDPVRKEIAKTVLEQLVADGRIHPARIEEIVHKVVKEIGRIVVEEGEKVVFDLGIHNLSPEAVKALGRLHFRTSYGQNVLMHTKEVAVLSGMLAAQVGADRDIAKRGAIYHDIGKGIESTGDKTHIELGLDLAKELGEDERVINVIGSHHGDVEPNCIEAIIVQTADAISAARPGARRESLDNYVKRLESLEKIAESFVGVEKCFAIQAGREIRIMVNNEAVDDSEAKDLAKQIAKRIETELRYPGRIKVTMIRETRIVEYAR